jgi:hypothetical protein
LERVYRSHGLVSENIDLNATRGSIIFFQQAKTVSRKSALVSIEERLGRRRCASTQPRGRGEELRSRAVFTTRHGSLIIERRMKYMTALIRRTWSW